ncbi:MAG: anthranilate phosphoribosyltransferase [Chloroflexi bacterium]|nr:MAG: anthranilate phosphoribosyltransferase [Chloroflexota bacterium]
MSNPSPDSSAFARMQYYLREIGTGPRGSRNLTTEEARDAMSLILRQEVAPSQAGGLLLLQRFKGESPEELLGFAQAIREGAIIIQPAVSGLLDVGSPYDGRKRSVVVSPASAIVAAAAGVPVVLHGERGLGPKHGVAVGDVLDALGIDTDAAPETTQRMIEGTGFGFMRQAQFVPQVFALKDLREEVALRTAISTIEKIYNLASADYSIIGLTHLPYAEKMVLAASRMGFKRILIIQGIEGNEDAPTSRPCRAFLWERDREDNEAEGTTTELRVNAAQFGLRPATKEEMAGGDAAENARIAEAVLAGEPGGHRDLVVLNAGLRIWLAERASSIGDGVELARIALDSGATGHKLEELRAMKLSV